MAPKEEGEWENWGVEGGVLRSKFRIQPLSVKPSATFYEALVVLYLYLSPP